jgi:hypothetical protein
VGGPHDAEVTAVGGGYVVDGQTFGGGYHGGIDRAEREVVIARHELGDADGVGRVHRLEHETSAGEVAEEPDLGLPAESRADQIGDLGDDEGGYDERPGVGLEELRAGGVMGIVGVDVGVQRAGIDDQRYLLVSARMISSMRSEMSLRPLRPAAFAPSRR